MAPFVVLMLFIAILIILPGSKDICLKIRRSPLTQSDYLKPKLSLCRTFAMKRER